MPVVISSSDLCSIKNKKGMFLFERNIDFLSVDGGFSLWSAWTDCSQTCGTGTKSRTRTCDNPVPNYNGQNCTGDYSEAISCKITSCPGKKDKAL